MAAAKDVLLIKSMEKRYGIINIGSLKTKCLAGFFDGKNVFTSLHWSNNLTCFGCGMYENNGQILEKNLENTIAEILKQKEIIRQYGCSNPTIFATHALRNAANRNYVEQQIEEKTGLPVKIIGPEEEGQLYFDTVISDFPAGQNYAVVDSGGGSVQILTGNREKLLTSNSFQTGAQVLHEKFTSDPHNPESITTEEDIKKMKVFLEEQYAKIGSELPMPIIYGSSNIIDLCKAVNLPLEAYQNSSRHPYKAQPQYFRDFMSAILRVPYGVREKRYPFQEGYMWGIDKAFLNITFLAEKFKSPYIVPSNASVVDGFLCKIRKQNGAS